MDRPADILLVEDNPGDSRLIREMLREGYLSRSTLITAESIAEARERIGSRSFGIIILDLNLPDSSGLLSLDEIIIATGGRVPVIVLTGLADEETGHSAIERGAGDYLVKGAINSAQLSRSVRYAMERHLSSKKLKNSEQFLREALDTLSSSIAILSADGVILQVNKAWREFAERNGAVVENVCEGADYFEACLRDEQGKAFAAGIRSVMSGERSTFEMEYPCHSPDEERWFRGTVTRFREELPTRVVVAHDNLTERWLSERQKEAAAEALRESEERYRMIFENSLDAFFLMEPDGSILSVNPAGCRMFGRSEEEIRALGRNRIIDTSDPRLTEGLKEREQTGRFHGELTGIRADGAKFPIEVSSTVFTDRHGVSRTSTVIHDITERKRAEEAIIARNRELAVLHDTAVELAALRLSKDLYAYVASRLQEITGAAAVTFGIYDTIKGEIHIKHAEMDRVLVTDLMRSMGGTQLGEAGFPVGDDMKRDLIRNPVRIQHSLTEMTFGMVPPEAGAAIQKAQGIDRFVGIAYIVEGELYGTTVLGLRRGAPDPSLEMLRSFAGLVAVSLRRLAAENALRESEEKYRRIVDTSYEGIWGMDAAHRTTYVNRRMSEMLGYDIEEVQGNTVESYMFGEDLADHGAQMKARHGGGAGKYERRFRRKDGSELWTIVSATPVFDESGGFAGSFGMFTDITERKNAEMKLEELLAGLERMVAERTAELEKANRELESFSYTVSHDLRAPLRHIHGFMELFRQEMGEVSNENAKHYMDVIGASAQRMSQLIDDLLSFSRMGRAEYSVTDVDMTSLVAEAAQSLLEEMEARSIDLRIGGLPAVRGDRSMMLVVFSNLLSNAVKFTSKRERPEISVSGEKAGEEAVFCVRDNGAGFDMRYADKLFGVFNRLHRESEYPGTGIGLATVRRIIERHGGRVWAEGAVDEGARFCFALPLRAGSSDRT